MVSSARRIAIATVSLATFGMVAAPVAAMDLPVTHSPSAPAAYDSHAGDAYNHRGWGRWGRHSSRHIRTGDAIAGIAILGAVAAIASASSRADRDRRSEPVRDRPVRYRENYRTNDNRDGGWNRGGITGAVDMCVGQVERGDDRVDSVDNAARVADGWRIDGSLAGGGGFSCRIDNEGRIRSVDLGDGYAAATQPAGGDSQWSDDAYRSARAATRPADAGARAAVDADLENQPQPAYPGGPLPGEEGYEDSLGG